MLRSIASFDNIGNRKVQITIDTNSMTIPVTSIEATIIYSDDNGMVTFSPEIEEMKHKRYRLTFTVAQNLSGLGNLSVHYFSD